MDVDGRIGLTTRRIGEFLDDPRGQKNVAIGLVALVVMLLLGWPSIEALLDKTTSNEVVTDRGWKGPEVLTGEQNWATPYDITFGSGRWVAVGSQHVNGADRPVAWYSADGTGWTPAVVELGPVEDTTAATMESVIRAHDAWLAVGHADAFGHTDSAIWTSIDGTSWRRVAAGDDRLGGPGTQEMFDVAPDGGGWRAIGLENFGDDANGAVWFSADGVIWERDRSADAALSGPGDQIPTSIVATGDDGWIIAGREDTAGRSDAAAWTLTATSGWRRVESNDFRGQRDDAIYSLGQANGRVVAVGASRLEETTDAVVWTSADSGASWSRVPYNRTIFGGPFDQRMEDVTFNGNTWVAFGGDERQDAFQPAVWVSNEGRHWRRVDAVDAFARPSAGRLVAGAASPDLMIGVGFRDDGSGRVGEVWRHGPDATAGGG